MLNESDVEQKFIYPLLISPAPYGFGIDKSVIHTKQNIRKLRIGKGSEAKIYFPDYLIVKGGFPIVIGEAKTPGSDLREAFREGRLYAAELNATFPAGLNPLTRLFSTDGLWLFAGYADQAEPTIIAHYDQISTYSPQMSELHHLFGSVELEKAAKILYSLFKPSKWTKARLRVGGMATQLEEVSLNSFGSTISADFAHVFNPTSRQDRVKIARDGYVNSARKQRYVGSIDRVIRASASISESVSRTIENTSKPHEIIAPFLSKRQLEHQVLLIIGSVGSGKSTFIDFVQEVALPGNVKDATVWVHLDMNVADISQNGIFDWIRNETVSSLQKSYPQLDFDELDVLKKIYSVEVNKFAKGVGKLFANPSLYDERLAAILSEADANLDTRMKSMCRFCGNERGRLIVVVMDNCDKRLRDEQLLMFQVAQWLQKTFRVLVILPLREETFDNHRNQPPLDTALKDMVFRIEPASFQDVLSARIQIAKLEILATPLRQVAYTTPNGIRVELDAAEQASYLESILRSVFEHSHQIRDLIVGLAGRNLRLALEIFMEFCTSGYLTEDHIFQMRQAHGRYVLPLEVSLAVLLRRGRRFYDSDHAYLKNMCAIEPDDQRPNYFSRLLVLGWLAARVKTVGTKGLTGYFPIGTMEAELSAYGVEQTAVRREIEYLAEAYCLTSEDFRVQGLQENDLICLGSAGAAHMEIMANPHFWAAVAEDTWTDDVSLAEEIATRISNIQGQHEIKTIYKNARAVLEMLKIAYERERLASEAILDESKFGALANLTSAVDGLRVLERQLVPPAWMEVDSKYRVGRVYKGKMTNRKEFGIFVELEKGVSGLLHVSRIPSTIPQVQTYVPGGSIYVKVLTVHKLEKRIELGWSRQSDESDVAGV